MLNLVNTLKFVRNLSRQVGKFLVENQDKVKVKKYKDREDIVTNIDLQAEEIIIKAIQKRFPGHNILSEEKGLIDKKSAYAWIVDPLDGTKEYFRGSPLYGSAILLEKEGKSLLAVVSFPKGNQYYSAALNKGAFLDERKGTFLGNKKIKVSAQNKLPHSFIYSNPPIYKNTSKKQFANYWVRLQNIAIASSRLRFLQFENLSLCFLAQGSCEAVINISNPVKMWDILPGLFIAQEAGAKTTNLKGGKINYKAPKQLFIASNGKIHRKILKILS